MTEGRHDEGEGRGDPRVLFAAERTLLAWIRTGLALMGFGFVVARFGLFLRELAAAKGGVVVGQVGASKWVGTALVLIGVLVNGLAGMRHVRFVRKYKRGEVEVPPAVSTGTVLAGVLAVVGIAMAIYLVLVR